MQISCALCVCFFPLLVLGSVGKADRSGVAGTWRGESICTTAASACNNEKVVYYIKDVLDDSKVLLIQAEAYATTLCSLPSTKTTTQRMPLSQVQTAVDSITSKPQAIEQKREPGEQAPITTARTEIDPAPAQELLAKQVGTYDESELYKLLLEMSLLDSAYQRSSTSRDDVLMDAAKRFARGANLHSAFFVELETGPFSWGKTLT